MRTHATGSAFFYLRDARVFECRSISVCVCVCICAYVCVCVYVCVFVCLFVFLLIQSNHRGWLSGSLPSIRAYHGRDWFSAFHYHLTDWFSAAVQQSSSVQRFSSRTSLCLCLSVCLSASLSLFFSVTLCMLSACCFSMWRFSLKPCSGSCGSCP